VENYAEGEQKRIALVSLLVPQRVVKARKHWQHTMHREPKWGNICQRAERERSAKREGEERES